MSALQFSLAERRGSNSLAGSRSTPEVLLADESPRWRSSGRRGVLPQCSRAQLRVNATDGISFAGACASKLKTNRSGNASACAA
ncbi:g4260 [Coccomyxa elongata]